MEAALPSLSMFTNTVTLFLSWLASLIYTLPCQKKKSNLIWIFLFLAHRSLLSCLSFQLILSSQLYYEQFYCYFQLPQTGKSHFLPSTSPCALKSMANQAQKSFIKASRTFASTEARLPGAGQLVIHWAVHKIHRLYTLLKTDFVVMFWL